MKKNPFQKTCPEVAVVLDLSGESARGIMRGILQFVRENTPWNITYIPSNVSNVDASTLSSWRGDGMITRLTRESTYRKILSLSCSTVLLCEEDFPLPTRKKNLPVFVRCEDETIGKMGAEYFLKRGFRHFAYIPNPVPYAWSQYRKKGFQKALCDAGFSFHLFQPSEKKRKKAFLPPTAQEWLEEREELAHWLCQLPQPIGILAANDFRGRQTLEACQYADIPVPYQAAVLGVNNDELVCLMAYPSLSSVAVHWEKAGFLAASALHRRMNNLPTPQEESYAPIHVISRNSTEKLHLADPLVVRIMEMIRINNGQNLQVQEMARVLRVSVRTAQSRFKKAVGHSIMEEIQRVRMRFVCNLLENSPLTINEIAEHCGFENANYLGIAFKRQFGMTMGKYRDQKNDETSHPF